MLSKREKTIAIVTAVLIALLVLNAYVFQPMMAARDQLASQRQMLERKVNVDHRLIDKAARLSVSWRRLHETGLGDSASAAQSALLNAMRQWSQQAGLTMVSIRPDQASSAHDLQELTFQASAHGSLQAIIRFLYDAQTGTLPVRIHELQIATRTPGKDDLTLQLRIGSLWKDTAKDSSQTASIAMAGSEAGS